VVASPFETPPFGRFLRVRPLEEIADFLILRASTASVSKDEENRDKPHAMTLL
jgi:hypothetical protein